MRVLLAAVCLIGFTFTSTAQDRRTPATQPLARLKVEVVDVRAKKGQLTYGVFKTADGFPKEEKKSVYWKVVPADTKTVVFECELPPGKYSASVLHDENSSGDMD